MQALFQDDDVPGDNSDCRFTSSGTSASFLPIYPHVLLFFFVGAFPQAPSSVLAKRQHVCAVAISPSFFSYYIATLSALYFYSVFHFLLLLKVDLMTNLMLPKQSSLAISDRRVLVLCKCRQLLGCVRLTRLPYAISEMCRYDVLAY